ncbi:MAG: 50S ribosomal protein L35 [Bacteroidetes bacterium]|mgnify:CR=1 FL=1|nr:50S ribosomal protein L35 [Bacteroidota bacterium]MCK6611159.1 50S ribosomal protein L35 [Bacteroidia bacterium]
MPKVKTNKAAAKRFKVTPSGKIKRAQAFKNHILTKKTTKQKRALTKMVTVSEADMGLVKNLLGIGK